MQLTLTRLASPNPNPNQVSINPSPGHPPPAEAVQAVTAATAAEPGFAIDAKSGRYAITVRRLGFRIGQALTQAPTLTLSPTILIRTLTLTR